MEWVALALLAAVGWLVARRRRRPSPMVLPELSPSEVAELEQGFARVEQEVGSTVQTLLAARLRVLASRGVPLRAIRRAPGKNTARLVFGNGTVLIARADRPGEIFALAVRMYHEGVSLESWHSDPSSTTVRFSWSGGGIDLSVIGLDQAE